jgi:hypothetical protein
MSEVERLMHEYVERYAAGGPADPREFLEQVEGAERTELAALIDAYLARAPRRDWVAEDHAGSPAPAVVESINRSLAGSGGLWPALLPRLRERARLRRAEVVDRLAAALGAEDGREKVAAYYHRMEQGLLPAAGVSERVLEALGTIVGESAEMLRRAGSALEPGPGAGGEGVAFARTATPDPRYEPEAGMTAPERGDEAEAVSAGEAGDWDDVDRLFRGG